MANKSITKSMQINSSQKLITLIALLLTSADKKIESKILSSLG